jgi:hypothetical protein
MRTVRYDTRMVFKSLRVSRLSCAVLVFTAACGGRGPAAPSTSAAGSVSSQSTTSAQSTEAALVGALSTGSVTTPRLLLPATNSLIANQSQPVTLVVANALVTKPGGTTYTFEVATDVSFSSKVQTKDGVAEGSGGQSSVTLDALAPSRDYYWHARATAGGTTGVFSAPFRFTVGAAIIINAPVPIGPLTGAQTTQRPALRVTNAVRSGSAGAITYKFEISTVASFASILMTGFNSEGVNETGFIPTSDLPTTGTLFWRATAMDVANFASSAPSPVQSFTASKPPSQAALIAAQLGVPLWPGAAPPGDTGHATMGNDAALGVGWAIQTLHYGPTNTNFQSPDIEMLRIFDLLDRGFDPDGAAAWMNANGYPTIALWYPPPEKAVIGLKYVYIAARGKVSVNGIWDLVLRVE